MFHGHGLRYNFFEGWYFKFADAPERRVWAVIPGIFLASSSQSEQESHSFVQIADGQSGVTHYHRYPLHEFRASPTAFDVRIGLNHFRSDFLSLDIDRPEQSISGTLHFNGMIPWPVTFTSPGIMGWYTFVPFMECYHGVLSLDHKVVGHLKLEGRDVDFTGGRGYIEKDWGQSFPRGWVWMQTNHFAKPGTSLTASVGRIPWLGSAFRGFIIGLWHDGRLYRFATYTGANLVMLKITDTRVRMQVQDARYLLEIEAMRSKGGLLHVPLREGMLKRLSHSLTAKVFVRLSQRSPSRAIFSGTGRHAGLEIAGEIDLIADL
jgi:hypothetical protein